MQLVLGRYLLGVPLDFALEPALGIDKAVGVSRGGGWPAGVPGACGRWRYLDSGRVLGGGRGGMTGCAAVQQYNCRDLQNADGFAHNPPYSDPLYYSPRMSPARNGRM